MYLTFRLELDACTSRANLNPLDITYDITS